MPFDLDVSFGSVGSHSGSAPEPFDALDGPRLAGPQGSRLAIPPGSAPSFDGAGLEINYVIRVLVDRRFRSDAAIERPLAIV